MEILDPTVCPDAAVLARSRRPQTLRGLTVGLLDNGKRNSAALLKHLGAALQRRYGVTAVVLRTKPSASTGAPPTLLAELKAGCDAVIAGVGD